MRAAWDAHHTANPDPKLVKGCCYGPPVADPDNGGTADTWNLAASSKDVISNITHNFAPETSATAALAEVVSQDLPADAQQVDDETEDTCRSVVYMSQMLAASGTGLGKYITVTLYGPVDASAGNNVPYSAADIREADEQPVNDTSC